VQHVARKLPFREHFGEVLGPFCSEIIIRETEQNQSPLVILHRKAKYIYQVTSMCNTVMHSDFSDHDAVHLEKGGNVLG